MLIKVIAGLKGEGLPDLFSKSGVANGTGIQALLPGKILHCDQVLCILFSGMILVKLNMISRGTMTSFAVNSINHLRFIKRGNVISILQHFCISAVTFEALRWYNSVELNKVV